MLLQFMTIRLRNEQLPQFEIRRNKTKIGVYLEYKCYLELRKKQKPKSFALSVKTKSSQRIRPKFFIKVAGLMDVMIASHSQ